jgi:hypothetical protein
LRDNSDASIIPLKLAHDEYRTNTKAGTIAAEVNFKKSVFELTKTVKADHFLTHGAKKRYNLLLVHDSLKPIAEQALAGKTPFPESELGFIDDALVNPRVHQLPRDRPRLRQRCQRRQGRRQATPRRSRREHVRLHRPR